MMSSEYCDYIVDSYFLVYLMINTFNVRSKIMEQYKPMTLNKTM